MDHLLAAFFSLVFAHPATTPQPLVEPVVQPAYTAPYESAISAPIRREQPVTINRHAGGYAVGVGFRTRS